MKKFLAFAFVAMAFCASLVSCSSDDDKNTSTPINPTPEPKPEYVSVYTCSVSGEVLDLYDISLDLTINGKVETVALEKKSCSKVGEGMFLTSKFDVYSYMKVVDGWGAITKVVANVAAKANAEETLKGMDKERMIPLAASIDCGSTTKAADYDQAVIKFVTASYGSYPDNMLAETDGIANYVHGTKLIAIQLGYKD